MQINLNNEVKQVEDTLTLEQLVKDLGYSKQGIAACLDSQIVPKGKWADTVLTAGCSVDIFNLVAGG